MASKTVVCADVDEQVLAKATTVLARFGLSVDDVVRMTLNRVVQDEAVPYEQKVPNADTGRDGGGERDHAGEAGADGGIISITRGCRLLLTLPTGVEPLVPTRPPDPVCGERGRWDRRQSHKSLLPVRTGRRCRQADEGQLQSRIKTLPASGGEGGPDDREEIV